MSGAADRVKAVTELLQRAAGRGEIIINYQDGRGYVLASANTTAGTLFGMPPQSFSQTPRPWEQLPPSLALYLSQAFEELGETPGGSLSDLRLENETIYKVSLFYATSQADATSSQEHWYLFCFEKAETVSSGHRSKLDVGKLENIGELASGVAHDFNNLIMGIQSNAESILALSETLGEKQRGALINIIRACTSGTALTRSLLGYAKRQPLTMTQFNIVEMIHDVVRIDALALDASHHLFLDDALNAKAEPILVTGCYASLSHCLLNLLKNAREATPNGGDLTLRWEGDEDTARLTVHDNGAGIAPEDLARIFEPFYSTKKNGTGLGLAMVKGILSQHEGTVEITSHQGAGTAVSLVWPRKTPILKPARRSQRLPDPRKATDEIVKPRAATTSTPGTIAKARLAFVIDDDELVRGGVVALLEHLGYNVESFGHAEAAIAAIGPGHVPKLILVDYHMPGMDGSEFIRYWHSELSPELREPDTQILLVSGHPPSQFQEIIRKYSEHNVGMLQKPFSLETLQKKLIDFSALRSITTRIRPQQTPRAHAVPIGNPSMQKAVVRVAPASLQTNGHAAIPRPRIAENQTPPS